MERRKIIKGGLVLIASATAASIFRPAGAAVKVFSGGEKWLSPTGPIPRPVDTSKRVFFTEREAELVQAVYDRLIPADELSISASQAGCVIFTDHQLAGPYGSAQHRYKLGPVAKGTPEQGEQTLITPADIYRKGLAEMDAHCKKLLGQLFTELPTDKQDSYLEQMEADSFNYGEFSSNKLFSAMLTNVKEGFLADPLYGGNKGMVGWKMIGFPGARYDYRDYVNIKGQRVELEPISLLNIG
ncbi:gluconate 2-dehydrogenase subunit 3 family protein [Enterobacteriaceae bacterium RIT697]|uniref:gluconate 2-dehydrogenase subunit 3 family protein n=1 Tax=Pantoea endophytica TaxID=92488 RepID=UPI0013BFFB91|nr:gluconate 2-dehydrogenase subunit 3 family protein [Pantoea endophytica]MRT24936.1 gluconate 2-dehydrogenase subunit 3 family protein [Enterobacteriaceae bacterium RIT697]